MSPRVTYTCAFAIFLGAGHHQHCLRGNNDVSDLLAQHAAAIRLAKAKTNLTPFSRITGAWTSVPIQSLFHDYIFPVSPRHHVRMCELFIWLCFSGSGVLPKHWQGAVPCLHLCLYSIYACLNLGTCKCYMRTFMQPAMLSIVRCKVALEMRGALTGGRVPDTCEEAIVPKGTIYPII